MSVVFARPRSLFDAKSGGPEAEGIPVPSLPAMLERPIARVAVDWGEWWHGLEQAGCGAEGKSGEGGCTNGPV